ncbi:AAA family ATPase [Deefgea sp. CFH1-16]|uniref:AAA family ATPase n=1 Tax=Deefgea sp. CFH1-16 TaxID=2675457 RepID=UPI0015F3D9E9|nr:AAA family ATPase [Deefgea sp. CFH1-16]MBM5574248.1 AAA family ATPase [Deefgea sp. CFH1-16]
MAILEGIQIQNFRALRDVTLGKPTIDSKNKVLPRFITVIGPNGVGKSSLMDALGFIGDCLQEGVQAACDKPHRGGFERMRTQGIDESIKFEIRYRENTDARPISYSLHINCDKYGRPVVVHERLRQRRKGQTHGQPHSFFETTDGVGTVWSGEGTVDTEGNARIEVKMSDRQVLGISTLGTLADHPRIALFRNFLSGWYLSYFVPQLARTQPIAGAEPHLDRTGENLAKYLQFISRANPHGFRQMLDRIAIKIPGITRIEPVIAPDKRLLLAFQASGYEEPFYQQDMSDGTLKMLAYMLLMEDPDPSPLVGIEEPENGLHHQLLGDLASEFKSFARKSRGPQLLITTHAPNFVDALAPEEVWILSKGLDGYSQLTNAADIEGVRAMFDEGIPMGSLWYSNHFGIGNP